MTEHPDYKNSPEETQGPYRFTWVDGGTAIVLDDTVEHVIFVMSSAQVEALLTWYAKKTNRLII